MYLIRLSEHHLAVNFKQNTMNVKHKTLNVSGNKLRTQLVHGVAVHEASTTPLGKVLLMSKLMLSLHIEITIYILFHLYRFSNRHVRWHAEFANLYGSRSMTHIK